MLDEISELHEEASRLGYPFYGVTASTSEEIAQWRYLTGASYPMLQLDATPIRTIIRSQPGLLVLRDGKIIDKRAYADFPPSRASALTSVVCPRCSLTVPLRRAPTSSGRGLHCSS